jgi:hypothetical protein
MTTDAKYDPNTGELIAGKEGQEQKDNTDYKGLYEQAQAKIAELSDVTKHKAYKTLQGDLQKKDELLVATRTQLEETTKVLDPLKAEHEKILKEHTTLKGTLAELEVTKDALTAKTQRASVIMGKFPNLAPFEAEGLLPETGPDDDPAKIEEIFGKFNAKISGIQQQASDSTKKDFLAGGVSKAAGAGGEQQNAKGATAAAELQAANDAVLKGDMKTYKEHFDKYLELSKVKV